MSIGVGQSISLVEVLQENVQLRQERDFYRAVVSGSVRVGGIGGGVKCACGDTLVSCGMDGGLVPDAEGHLIGYFLYGCMNCGASESRAVDLTSLISPMPAAARIWHLQRASKRFRAPEQMEPGDGIPKTAYQAESRAAANGQPSADPDILAAAASLRKQQGSSPVAGSPKVPATPTAPKRSLAGIRTTIRRRKA